MANLLSLPIPEEVIEGTLLPFLYWNDLLRFRRVCKELHKLTTKYMRLHPELSPEIEINEENRTFKTFIKMDIPTTKIFVRNISGTEFYDKHETHMIEFLDKYGELIKSLKLEQISLYPIQGNEFGFFSSFPNLLHLEVGYFGIDKKTLRRLPRRHDYIHDPCTQKHGGVTFPAGFSDLKSIKVGNNPHVEICNIVNRTNAILNGFRSLKYASLPFAPYIDSDLLKCNEPSMMPFTHQFSLKQAFSIIVCNIGYNRVVNGEYTNLKELDFLCYHDHHKEHPPEAQLLARVASDMFLILCNESLESGVMLGNVDASWFQARLDGIVEGRPPGLESPLLGRVVKSMVNLHHSIISLELPNLESVKIITSESRMTSVKAWRRERNEWPSLKKLDIFVDSEAVMDQPGVLPGEPEAGFEPFFTKDIFAFLFQGVRHLTVTELNLKFEPECEKVIGRIDDIVEACPNVKKLSIVKWTGTNKALLKFWEGLHGLEEITLEECENVGNVTFVGMVTRKPVFFKLKNLKKLSLKGLDKMPKVTDLLFSMVIRHLNLTHFIITSSKPLENITQAGIRSLLDGKFANSIEKFPFSNWFLANVSNMEFKKLETEFRSYHMI